MDSQPDETRSTNKAPGEIPEKKKQRRDFWLALILSFIINISISLLIDFTNTDPDTIKSMSYGYEMYCWLMMLNIATIFGALVLRRPAITLGMMASYLLVFALVVIANLVFFVFYFVKSGEI